ncbi:MAG: hypothetical protein ACR2KB_18665 [Chitinophagaceae bacterium]
MKQLSGSSKTSTARALVLQRTSDIDKLKSKGEPVSASFDPFGIVMVNKKSSCWYPG